MMIVSSMSRFLDWSLLTINSIAHSVSIPPEQYFNDMNAPKPHPLILCAEAENGIKFRIPEAPVCSSFLQHNHSEVVNLTFFWEDLNITEVRGYECWGQSQTFRMVWDFKYMLSRSEKTYISDVSSLAQAVQDSVII